MRNETFFLAAKHTEMESNESVVRGGGGGEVRRGGGGVGWGGGGFAPRRLSGAFGWVVWSLPLLARGPHHLDTQPPHPHPARTAPRLSSSSSQRAPTLASVPCSHRSSSPSLPRLTPHTPPPCPRPPQGSLGVSFNIINNAADPAARDRVAMRTGTRVYAKDPSSSGCDAYGDPGPGGPVSILGKARPRPQAPPRPTAQGLLRPDHDVLRTRPW